MFISNELHKMWMQENILRVLWDAGEQKHLTFESHLYLIILSMPQILSVSFQISKCKLLSTGQDAQHHKVSFYHSFHSPNTCKSCLQTNVKNYESYKWMERNLFLPQVLRGDWGSGMLQEGESSSGLGLYLWRQMWGYER